MSIVSVQPKDFILALFIRDDGERFLLGDGGYDFKDSQLHFVGNTIENDEVAKQGTDGTLLAGQVRRSAIQSFDGYVGDATMAKEAIEQMRRDFIAFFMKGHHFRVVYVDCARNAWQRKGGYLVDAPEVKELWQINPEYHVALNFEDVNYYVYDENTDGDEILAIVQSVPISSEVEGGLEWDANGAISDAAQMDNETKSVSGSNIRVTDAVVAPFASIQLEGNTSQDGTPTPSAPVAVKVVTGENVVKICGKNLFDGSIYKENYVIASNGAENPYNGSVITTAIKVEPNTTYTASANWDASTPDKYMRVGIYTSDMTFIRRPSSSDSGAPITFTTPANARYVRLSYFVPATEVQLELGSSATAYEPYQGRDYEIDLGDDTLLLPDGTFTNAGVSGVFDKNTIAVSRTSANSNTSFIRVNLEKPVTIHAGDTFTLYAENYQTIGTTDAGGAYMSIRMATSSQDDATTDVFLGSANASTTITATADKTYTRFVVRTASSLSPSNILIKPKLIINGQDKSIELCGLGDDGAGGYLYKDGIYKNLENGKWYVRKEVGKFAFPNTGWLLRTDSQVTDGSVFRYSNYVAGEFVTGAQGISSHLIVRATSSGNVLNTMRLIDMNTYGYNVCIANAAVGITSSDSNTEKQNKFATWCDSNSPVCYYVKATPTDTEITNEALVGQLNNLKAGGTLAGINNIAIMPAVGNENGTLEIQYYTKYSPVPIDGGYVWEEGGEGGPTTVINESIAEVYPVWTVPGPALNPTLENATTGEQIEFVGMVGEGQTLVVDMGAQTASLNGLNVISSMAGEFISLKVGQNTLLYSAGGDAGASEIGWSPIVG